MLNEKGISSSSINDNSKKARRAGNKRVYPYFCRLIHYFILSDDDEEEEEHFCSFRV